MLGIVRQWFEPVTVSQDYSRSDYVLLGLIVLTGTVLRFWGLDNVGLHGDEETMALPAMALLETGEAAPAEWHVLPARADPHLPDGGLRVAVRRIGVGVSVPVGTGRLVLPGSSPSSWVAAS